MLLRARVVLPVARPAIEDGAVLVAGGKIVKVAHWSAFSPQERSKVIDLGDVLLLPGLINAHCHLDYTGMAGKIPPRKSFADWIKAIVALKGSWSSEEFARSWKAGADMLLRNGVTTVVDVESIPELIPGMWKQTPLRVISCRELMSIKNRSTVREQTESAIRAWASLPADRTGLSPHAPYTTCAELLQIATIRARERTWPLTTHLAESEEEFQMYQARSGALFEWLRTQRDMSDCGHRSPVQHFEHCGFLQSNLIAAHANYLVSGDASLLGRRGVTVVHCPRCHAYFQHRRFPRQEFVAARVNLCLGTDSLASVWPVKQRQALELNLFAEMQLLAGNFPDLRPTTILKMVTINGARALHCAGKMGELTAGARADCIALPFAGKKRQAARAAVYHNGPVFASMINGQWAIRPGTQP